MENEGHDRGNLLPEALPFFTKMGPKDRVMLPQPGERGQAISNFFGCEIGGYPKFVKTFRCIYNLPAPFFFTHCNKKSIIKWGLGGKIFIPKKLP